jgi:hypothetical protein
MGLLNLFSKGSPQVQVLPSGSLTLDRNGKILASTVRSVISSEVLEEIGSNILEIFRHAREAQVPLNELIIQFASLQITARELRGGAMIFLTPKHSFNVSPKRKSEL